MTTHSFNDLKKLVPIASAKVNNNLVTVDNKTYLLHIEKDEYPDRDEAVSMIMKTIEIEYKNAISYNSQEINCIFMRVYGRPIRFSDTISELIYKIKTIMSQLGVSIEQMCKTIRNYVGYNCSFFRRVGDREVPITSDRLVKAYELIQKRASFINVENALYL